MDLEWAYHDKSEHIVSLAIVPVVRGKRTTDGELYVEMNPVVPIDAETSAVHGFTDEHVKGKRRFSYYAPKVLAALGRDDAVLVTHTSIDVRVLGEAVKRAEDETQGRIAFADLPDLPLLDTSTLPRLVQHPSAAGRPSISLRALCEALDVSLVEHHNARADARATADVLVRLLRHTAQHATFGSLEDLLRAAAAGTAQNPRGVLHVRGSSAAPRMPTEHIQAHAHEPLTHAGTTEEHLAWLARAKECVRLRCPLLEDEATLAAPHNAAALLDPLAALVDADLQPGQAGTLAGALRALIRESGPVAQRDVTSPALPLGKATLWWRKLRPRLHAAARCSRSERQACPACWSGEGCPTDLLHQVTTEVTVFAHGPLTEEGVRSRLIKSNMSQTPGLSRTALRWVKDDPVEAAYLIELVCKWCDDRGSSAAAYVAEAAQLGVVLREPRLALRWLRIQAGARGFKHAARLAGEVLAHRTTDPAYEAIDAWLALNAAAEEARVRRTAPRVLTRPRLARPEGRIPENPYRPF